MANIVRAASRRDVLTISAATFVGGLMGAARAGAAPKSLTMMHESSFIPPYDAYFKNKLAPAYEKATGIKINYETTSVGSQQTRVTTAAETGNGPDMAQIAFNWAFLFDEKLVDVTDIAQEIGKKGGGWHDAAAEACIVNGKWKAIPFGNIGQLMNYRMDWFSEVGVKDFPDTWDGLLEAGTKLKKAGHPFGFELGHGFGDNHGWPVFSYGTEYSKEPITDLDEHPPEFARPVWQWTPSIAPSGMAFYAGAEIPEWEGSLLVGALRGSELVRLTLDGTRVAAEERMLGELGVRFRDVTVGPDGAVYVLTDAEDGAILRIVAAD
ncbi:MAG: extracellular solute-binding protein [Rhodospirillales bacterium]|nr:extracellular solute-binding protein [Rhodospirillales bacterium]